MKTIKAVAAFVLVCCTVLCGQARPQPPEAFGKLPMSLQANAGQVVPDVKFLSRGRGYEPQTLIFFAGPAREVSTTQERFPQDRCGKHAFGARQSERSRR